MLVDVPALQELPEETGKRCRSSSWLHAVSLAVSPIPCPGAAGGTQALTPAWHCCTAQHWRSCPKEFVEQTLLEPCKARKPQVSAAWLLPKLLLEVLELHWVAGQRAGDNLIGDCTEKPHPNSSIQPHSLHTLPLPGTALRSCCWLGCAPWKHYHHFLWKDEAAEVWTYFSTFSQVIHGSEAIYNVKVLFF